MHFSRESNTPVVNFPCISVHTFLLKEEVTVIIPLSSTWFRRVTLSLCLICPISSYYLSSLFISVILSLYLTSPANLVSLHLICPVFSSYLSNLFISIILSLHLISPVLLSYLPCFFILPATSFIICPIPVLLLSLTSPVSSSHQSQLFVLPVLSLRLLILNLLE